MKDSERFKQLWNTFFKRDEELENKTVEFVNKAHFRLYNNTQSKRKLICVHIRTGKNPTLPNDWSVQLPVDQIDPLWNFIANYTKDSRKQFTLFVATDSEEVRIRSHLLFPDLAMDPGGDIGHIDQLNPNDTHTCAIFQKALLDQSILTKCDTFIMTNSQFGGNAAHLRENSKETYCFNKGKVIHGYCLYFEGYEILLHNNTRITP